MTRSIHGAAWTFLLVPLVAVAACSSTRDYPIGSDCAHGFCEQGPSLAPSADGGDASIPDPASVLMCPVTTCALPWMTCPSSEFPCGTNLLTDDDNCGSCGNRCAGADLNTFSKWTCVSGKCAFSCSTTQYMDCDNDPSNGCETFVVSDINNCGTCGTKCKLKCDTGVCYDECAQTNLPDTCSGGCTDLQDDDFNCGTCGNVCDPTGPNLPSLPGDMSYGCRNGICGQKKCLEWGKSDCNNDASDGCEMPIHTNEHCSGCFDACPAGKDCGFLGGSSTFACMCPDDAETFCGYCVRLADDLFNCGGCGAVCPGFFRPHFEPTCTFGVCGGKCEPNYADCDELSGNGCEVNTFIDNRNCGACGNACLPNQICSQGKCLVTPCDAGVPGDPVK